MDILNRAKGAFAASVPATFDKATTSPYILPVVVGLLAVIIIVVIVVVVYQYKGNRPGYQTLGPIDLFKPASVVVVDRTTTKAQMGGSYTLSFYVKIDAVPDMRNGATRLMSWSGVWELDYNPATESAILNFLQVPDSRNDANLLYTMTIPGLPLQRWTQVTITSAGRSVDVYLNGALAQSAQLDNVPASADASIILAPSLVMGQLAYVQLWSRRFMVGEVGANYTATSDSQGRPYLGVGFLSALGNFKLPNLFCPSGNCGETSPKAQPSQTWEFPYA